MRISDWSSDVCSSDLFESFDELTAPRLVQATAHAGEQVDRLPARQRRPQRDIAGDIGDPAMQRDRFGTRVAAENRGVARSAEGRVGKECGSKFRPQWLPDL